MKQGQRMCGKQESTLQAHAGSSSGRARIAGSRKPTFFLGELSQHFSNNLRCEQVEGKEGRKAPRQAGGNATGLR